MSAAPRRSRIPIGEHLALKAASVGRRPRIEYDGHDFVAMISASRTPCPSPLHGEDLPLAHLYDKVSFDAHADDASP